MQELSILVVGGGISAAIALCSRGHRVTAQKVGAA